MREMRKLMNFAQVHQGQQLVLAKIVSTKGSTYRKAGAQKLIAPDGKSEGLLSGGCMEADIVEKALHMKSNRETHSFDTLSEDDRFLGYELGCVGKITVEFTMIPPGQWLPKEHLGIEGSELAVHIVGAGDDLDPLYELLQWTGWQYQFYTHQTDLLKNRKQAGWPIQHLDRSKIHIDIDQPDRTALLLMSHNYPTDLEVLAHVSHQSLAYVGILGPKKRRDQMLKDLQKVYGKPWPEDQIQKVRGPIGWTKLGRGESAISLSIVSELQAVFFGERQ